MMPSDNEDDYDDGHEPFDPDDEDAPEALVWNLLLLINPGDEETALQQFDAWREGLADGDADANAAWRLKDVIDWRSGFYVDWKDTESFIECVDELAARWNLRIDWGGDRDDEDFLEFTDVPALMAVAHGQLREHGYTLWNWNTDGDACAGWIALSRDDEGMRALAQALDIELRPGSDAF